MSPTTPPTSTIYHVGARVLADLVHGRLQFVRYMGNNLNGAAKVFALTFRCL